MKKLNRQGFVLAETLIVTVFLMVIFAQIYTNFFPLIGEYEKREVYDNIDGKYSIFWIKRMIESTAYSLSKNNRSTIIINQGYFRFQCSDLEDGDSRTMCRDIVSALQVNGCNKLGDDCDIYITKYQIGNSTDTTQTWFKNVVRSDPKRFTENCTENETTCTSNYVTSCEAKKEGPLYLIPSSVNCTQVSKQDIFADGMKDYLIYLPDYTLHSVNGAQYRVFTVFHNTKDGNNYYSFATIEVNRS